MKSRCLAAAFILAITPLSANADGHGHYGYGGHHHNHGGNRWIAPTIIGGVIAGSALYGITRDRDVMMEREATNDELYRRELVRQELREEQLRQRERELERRERQLYGGYNNYGYSQPPANYDERCNEYYRNNGDSNYYSRNCW